MTDSEKTEIYDRLLSMDLKIEVLTIPNPRYLNEKIGECHVLLSEAERYYIKLSKEISVIQKAFNNATSAYDTEFDSMLANDEDIKSLPSIKDREARLKNILKPKYRNIKTHENELSDLNILLKAVNLKIKNLNQTNNDIKTQIRIMESHIRLGETLDDNTATELSEEVKRKMIAVDTSISEDSTVDSTESLNVSELLGDSNSEEEIPNKLIDPESEIGTDLEDVAEEEIIDISDEAHKEVDKIQDPPVIEIEKIIEDRPVTQENQKIGGDTEKETVKKNSDNIKKVSDIDIDALLKQFS